METVSFCATGCSCWVYSHLRHGSVIVVGDLKAHGLQLGSGVGQVFDPCVDLLLGQGELACYAEGESGYESREDGVEEPHDGGRRCGLT